MSNNYALSVLQDAAYLSLQNPGIQAALAAVLQQLTTYRFQGTVVSAVAAVRDVIDDIIQGETGQSVQSITTPPEVCELLLTDSTVVTALTAIRSYLDTMASTSVVAPLQSGQSFVALVRAISESI